MQQLTRYPLLQQHRHQIPLNNLKTRQKSRLRQKVIRIPFKIWISGWAFTLKNKFDHSSDKKKDLHFVHTFAKIINRADKTWAHFSGKKYFKGGLKWDFFFIFASSSKIFTYLFAEKFRRVFFHVLGGMEIFWINNL